MRTVRLGCVGVGVLDLPGLIGRLEPAGCRGDFGLEMFSRELWNIPVGEAARRMYESALVLAEDR